MLSKEANDYLLRFLVILEIGPNQTILFLCSTPDMGPEHKRLSPVMNRTFFSDLLIGLRLSSFGKRATETGFGMESPFNVCSALLKEREQDHLGGVFRRFFHSEHPELFCGQRIGCGLCRVIRFGMPIKGFNEQLELFANILL